ncbi:Isopenicillin N synthase [Tistlia consotensis]|uniref:2-oxoglutarate-dependent ethylene/succinate-forming enzyme n=1 Tax=Tistlia consotensis USBA 355 TaxID=560819 RepID=A0A1Y6C464_9PROT|nr:2-oxoglutarate and iron-dependent oxygenase domain-containing protein [Tistlia consotensis]SMF36146.1 Isopenicillin N synthase [Tistlia consotensis USBA 355]SNR71515.1 Isopenicillin N synthase [Tistlia consotensis]
MHDLQANTRNLDRHDQAARRLDFSEIPQVDIAGLRGGDPAAAAAVGAALAEAMETVGFVYVTGHGMPGSQLDATFEAMARYFERPEAEKAGLDIHKLARHRGYVPFEGLHADPHEGGADLQEAFELGLELPADDPDYLAGNMMYGPNVWPERPAEFRPVLSSYLDGVHAIGRLLFHGIALGLGLPKDWFDDKIGKPMIQLRAIHYPQQPPREVDGRHIGIGAHSDYECFTILAASQPGLQVRNRRGEWIDAPPLPGAFIINIGDCMERWTNGRLVSTVHRVINRSGAERYSLAFFFGADYEATIECLPTCQGPDNPPKYPPVKAGDWTTSNIKAAYTYRASEDARR